MLFWIPLCVGSAALLHTASFSVSICKVYTICERLPGSFVYSSIVVFTRLVLRPEKSLSKVGGIYFWWRLAT
ncbi:hypothetical protein BJY04DRAFT_200758 [Aspergillus karnatakaensis]|uniref:uncharacterized protein n=1 Tax=Aspergillus karnatakaensis TaxID=1810916 RepID=UPI003CCCE857